MPNGETWFVKPFEAIVPFRTAVQRVMEQEKDGKGRYELLK
jgi:hypothetical protein